MEAEKVASATQEQAARAAEAASTALEKVDESIREFAETRPLLALGGALLAGYLIGRLTSRS